MVQVSVFLTILMFNLLWQELIKDLLSEQIHKIYCIVKQKKPIKV